MNKDYLEKQDYLREEVRTISQKIGLKYDYFSNKLIYGKQSFYNFMGKQKNLSPEKEERLKKIIERLKNNDL